MGRVQSQEDASKMEVLSEHLPQSPGHRCLEEGSQRWRLYWPFSPAIFPPP